MNGLRTAAGELAAVTLVAAVLGMCGMFGHQLGYREGMQACATASARAEAAALAQAARIEHAQIAEQAKVAAAVQAQKTVTGAALTRVQGQIVSLPPRPHDCDIGPETITALNGLRGQP